MSKPFNETSQITLGGIEVNKKKNKNQFYFIIFPSIQYWNTDICLYHFRKQVPARFLSRKRQDLKFDNKKNHKITMYVAQKLTNTTAFKEKRSTGGAVNATQHNENNSKTLSLSAMLGTLLSAV